MGLNFQLSPKFEMGEKKIIQNNVSAKEGDQLLDVELQNQKQFWNRDAKRYPKTTTSHIHFTYWLYQDGLGVTIDVV